MTYDVRPEKKSDHLYVELKGLVRPGMAGQVAGDVIEAYTRDPSPRLLVDVRGLGVQVEPAETLSLVDSYANIAKGLRVKTAVVCREKDVDVLRFYELVSQNRGYPTEVFVDIDQALSWLRS